MLNDIEQKYQALFEQSPYGILLVDTKGKILDFNETAHRDLGYTREEFANLTIADIDPDESAVDVASRISQLIEAGRAEFETRHLTKQGEIRYVHNITKVVVLSGQTLLYAIWRDITEQKRAAEALFSSQKIIEGILNAAPVRVFWKDKNHVFLGCNTMFARDAGFADPKDIIGKDDYQMVWHDQAELYRSDDRAVMDSGRAKLLIEEPQTTFKGDTITLLTSKVPLRNSRDEIIGVLGTYMDITERNRAEKELSLFKNLIERSNDSITIIDPETGRFLIVNDKACADLGCDRKQLLTMSTLDIEARFPDQATWDDHVNEVKSRGSMVLEGMNRRQDGTLFPVEVNVTYMTLGGMNYMVAVVRDITKRKEADAALREREKQLSESQRIAHVGSWEHNLTTGEVVWSDELFRIMGLDPRKDPGDFRMFFDMIHPEDRPVLKNAIDETVQTGKPFNLEYRFNLRDGRTRILHAQAELIHDETGTQNILSGTGQDITDRKEVEEKIRQSEDFVRNILDTVDEGFIVIDRDFRILIANKAYCSQVGEPCNSVVGRNCYELSHKTLRPCYEEGEECAVLHVFETGEPHTALHKHPDAKGSILYIETKAFPIKDSTGAVTSVIETVNNITEKHLLEEEQLKSQKLEAIGTLAGGIAHDFNNLLQGVFGYISMAKIMHDQKQKSLDMLEQAEKALNMSVNLAAQLLTFSKGGKPLKKSLALRPVIENSVKFALSGARVDHRIQVDEELWMVEADEGQIGQVIQNLALNAAQAMPMGGTITITARNVSARQKELPSVLRQGNYVVMSIKDSGIGIPEQYLPKIFDPYFTTKDKGSGLGLATSYSIIKNHGGFINVKSKPGEGTIFFVYLPATEALETSAVAVSDDVQAIRKGRILLMDDEEIIRNIAGIMIRSLGHEVEIVENGEEAIARYRESMNTGSLFDIVIMDLTVRGGMGGEETIKELLQIDPDIKAIVSSGYTETSAIAEYKTIGFRACLTKPYDIASLNKTLNSLLVF